MCTRIFLLAHRLRPTLILFLDILGFLFSCNKASNIFSWYQRLGMFYYNMIADQARHVRNKVSALPDTWDNLSRV